MLQTILSSYGLDKVAEPFGTGLINHTWIVNNGMNRFILQRINDNIFKNPEDIASNIRLIADYLQANYPDYLFVTPEKDERQHDFVHVDGEGYFRVFPFVKNSHTIDVVSSPSQAFEAAQQFGRFTKLLSKFPVTQLKITLPDFHNLQLRYQQFETAIENGDVMRIKNARESIEYLVANRSIVTTSEEIKLNYDFRIRVTHHDTKISNVLFDANDRGLCVIDLDTVMPGYFISDVGDMLRTYLSPVSEEETDLSKISIRMDFFTSIARGYLGEMKGELSKIEKQHFVYAGKFMIYMQALRFLSDYLNKDTYYGAAYEEHNLNRANNQIRLLQLLIQQEERLNAIISAM